METEPSAVQRLPTGDECLVPLVYEDRAKGLRKERVSFQLTSVEKPSELCRCLVTVYDVQNVEAHQTEYLTSADERWITMGTAVTPVDCYVELLLQQMLPNEESRCTIQTKQHGDITFTIKLIRIEDQQYYYEQTATSALELAKRYKANGVLMYPKYPTFAQAYFNRAAKCLMSWSPIEQLDPAIEGPGKIEEMQALLQTLQLNISACLIKENRYEEALHVLRFTDQQEQPSEKATYRKALAQFRINQFTEAIATLEKINYTASKECSALYKQIDGARQQETNKYTAMVKKMFG